MSNELSVDLVNISVVLPVNRVDAYFHDAVMSILNQTLTDFELIIVANGCCDQEVDEIEFYQSDTRVKVIKTDLVGVSFASNLGIHHARGKYIARMDADDVSLETRLAEQYNYIVAHPDVMGISSAYALIDENGAVFRKGFIKERDGQWIRRRLPLECCLAHPTMLIERECLLAVGGYSYGNYSEDYDLWLRLLRTFPSRSFYRLGKELLHYRRHPLQATSRSRLSLSRKYNFCLRFREFLFTYNVRFLFGNLLPARLVHWWLGQ